MRRIAIFSDIHGNAAALDAVLDDIAAAGVGESACLGDLVGYGPDPGGVIARVRDLGIPVVRGNYDRGVGGRLGDCGCYYTSDQAAEDGEASYAFTVGALTERDLAWLYDLPDEHRFDHDGARFLLTHGSPRKINEYLMPDRSDDQLARLADEADADVVCVGHIHLHYHRSIETEGGPIHYVSSGSVGKPKDGDTRAGWVELLIGSQDEVADAAPDDPAAGPVRGSAAWVATRVHRAEYDIRPVAAAMFEAGLPERLVRALHSA